MIERDSSIENYICRTITENPGYMQAQIKVPNNGIQQIVAGEVFKAEELDTEIRNNVDVYIPELISSESDVPVIVLNGGFETLQDGRRPDGQPDYTQYIFMAGDVATAVRLDKEIKFELSPDGLSNLEDFRTAFDNNSVVGTYLCPTLDSSSLTWVEDLADVPTKVYLLIEAIKYFRLGGQFGADFATTLVVRVKHQNINVQPEPPVDPEITAIGLELTPDLQVGNENVASGAVIGTLSAEGGTEPITFSLEPNEIVGADNASFVIEGNEVKVNDVALAEAKEYKIYVKAEDEKGKFFDEGFDIIVVEA